MEGFEYNAPENLGVFIKVMKNRFLISVGIDWCFIGSILQTKQAIPIVWTVSHHMIIVLDSIETIFLNATDNILNSIENR